MNLGLDVISSHKQDTPVQNTRLENAYALVQYANEISIHSYDLDMHMSALKNAFTLKETVQKYGATEALSALLGSDFEISNEGLMAVIGRAITWIKEKIKALGKAIANFFRKLFSSRRKLELDVKNVSILLRKAETIPKEEHAKKTKLTPEALAKPETVKTYITADAKVELPKNVVMLSSLKDNTNTGFKQFLADWERKHPGEPTGPAIHEYIKSVSSEDKTSTPISLTEAEKLISHCTLTLSSMTRIKEEALATLEVALKFVNKLEVAERLGDEKVDDIDAKDIPVTISELRKRISVEEQKIQMAEKVSGLAKQAIEAANREIAENIKTEPNS